MPFSNYLLLNTALVFSQNLLMDNSHLLCKCVSSSIISFYVFVHIILLMGVETGILEVYVGVHLTDSYFRNQRCVRFNFHLKFKVSFTLISIDFLQRNANQEAPEKGKEIECRRKALWKKTGNWVPSFFLKGIFFSKLWAWYPRFSAKQSLWK